MWAISIQSIRYFNWRLKNFVHCWIHIVSKHLFKIMLPGFKYQYFKLFLGICRPITHLSNTTIRYRMLKIFLRNKVISPFCFAVQVRAVWQDVPLQLHPQPSRDASPPGSQETSMRQVQIGNWTKNTNNILITVRFSHPQMRQDICYSFPLEAPHLEHSRQRQRRGLPHLPESVRCPIQLDSSHQESSQGLGCGHWAAIQRNGKRRPACLKWSKVCSSIDISIFYSLSKCESRISKTKIHAMF